MPHPASDAVIADSAGSASRTSGWQCARTRRTSRLRYKSHKPTVPVSKTFAFFFLCIYSDTMRGMYTFIRSSDFDVWLAGLKDNMGKARNCIAFVLLNRVILVIARQSGTVFPKCAFTLVRAITCIFPGSVTLSVPGRF